MDYETLCEFLSSKMRLSHIYQPLLVRSLIEAGGTATIRQLATAFLSQDESQLIYYENRLKAMPIRILVKHGVITTDDDLVKLNVSKLSLQQKAELKRICEQRLQTYISERGLAIWDYRMLDTEPVSDSLRYRVLKESGGRCALCGATRREVVLDVDHIIPRSKGGKTEYENLQVLCARCNRTKGNRDRTSFKVTNPSDVVEGCVFCLAQKTREILEENDHCVAFLDSYPVTEGHTLVVPRRHVVDYFEMSQIERYAADDLIRIRRRVLLSQGSGVEGFNVGANVGECAGQTIGHCHVHLIPRREGDNPNPRGGVRGVIPSRQTY